MFSSKVFAKNTHDVDFFLISTLYILFSNIFLFTSNKKKSSFKLEKKVSNLKLKTASFKQVFWQQQHIFESPWYAWILIQNWHGLNYCSKLSVLSWSELSYHCLNCLWRETSLIDALKFRWFGTSIIVTEIKFYTYFKLRKLVSIFQISGKRSYLLKLSTHRH